MKGYLLERALSSILSELGYPPLKTGSTPPYRMPGASRWKRTASGRFSLIEKAEPSTPSGKDEKGQ